MRYTKMAAVAAAILVLGTMSVAMFSSQPGRAQAAKAEAPVPQLPLESWYFPAQYVNQATEIEEQVHEFY